MVIDVMQRIRRLIEIDGFIPAITIWQPWASLIEIEAKLYETRGWATKYRGPILIHAGAKPSLILDRTTSEAIIKAFDWPYSTTKMDIASRIRALPHRSIVAIAEIVECWTVVARGKGGPEQEERAVLQAPEQGCKDSFLHRGLHSNEVLLGDYAVSRFAWELAGVQRLPEPIPAKGKQGLWRWKG